MRIVNYTTADARTSALQTQATRNWEANEDEWTVPIGTFVSKVVGIAGQKVSLQGGRVGTSPAPTLGPAVQHDPAVPEVAGRCLGRIETAA